MMKPLSFGALLLGATLPVWAAEATTPVSPQAPSPTACVVPAVPLDLATVVQLALCRHPDTRTAWLNVEAQTARVDSVRATYRPTLDAGLGQTRSFGDSATPGREDRSSADLSMGWLLYDFGARAANKTQVQRTLEALQATRDATLQQVLQQTVDAYYQWMAADAALLAARDADTAAAETLRAAGVRQRVGVATREDVLQAQTALSQARLSVLSREGEQQVARGRMAVMLGLSAGTTLSLAPVAALPENPALPALEPFLVMVEQRPDMVAQRQRVAASEAALSQVRANYRPDLRLSASQSWSHDAANDSEGGSVGLRLSIPLYSGGQRAADIRLAEAQLALVQTALEQQQQNASQEIWEGWQSLRTATASFTATQDLVSAAEESHRAALARYKAGLGDLINVLNAQSVLANARQQFVEARFDWARSRISLARLTGTLGMSSLEMPAENQTSLVPMQEVAP
jgi:outer membrane protein